ncbi:MAG: electron transport complex subunit E [Lentisphaeria bacterium]
MSAIKTLCNGLWRENPVLILMLGMCPTLAVSTSAKNALGMGLATTFVLIGSNFVISLSRKLIPAKVRIPCYIVIIATFVTIVEQLMQAYAPAELNRALGIYIPLIVVNCIVLGRAEAFASKNGMLSSLMDGLGMGLGFSLALVMLGAVRELIAAGTFFELQLIPNWPGIHLLKTPTGAFLVLAFFLAVINQMKIRKCRLSGQQYEPPAELSCRSCSICNLSDRD